VQNIKNSNFAHKSFEPVAISITEKTATPDTVYILFARPVTIEFNLSLLRMLPTDENGFSVPRTLKKIIGAIFDSAREGLNDTSWINYSLKIILKNCFISPISQMPTSSHESSHYKVLPAIKNSIIVVGLFVLGLCSSSHWRN